MGMGSSGVLAGRRHSWRRGAGPADAPRNSRPLLALVTPGSRRQALASGDGRVDGDETPRVSTSHTGTAILNLPVPLGFQPGTFGGPLLVPVPTVQSIPVRCKHRPLASARSRVSVEDRRRPLLTVSDPRPKEMCPESHSGTLASPRLAAVSAVLQGCGSSAWPTIQPGHTLVV